MPEFPVAIDPADWVCPLPLRETRRIVLGHGGGGVLSEELIENLFLPAFGGTRGATRDSALLDVAGGRIALTTDSYVVQPLFFPGGNIGNLAVNGTINDLACSGAQPIGLTAGFILEEGLELDVLGVVAETMGRAAAQAGVNIVTGDTKVVAKGGADQLFVNTAGVGLVPPGLQIGPERARPGDHIIVSGNLGEHGVAIMSVREGIDFGTVVTTDSTPLHRLVAATLDAAGSAVHVLRPHPGRTGGIAGRARPRGIGGCRAGTGEDPYSRDGFVGLLILGTGPAAGCQRGQDGGVRRPGQQRSSAGGDAVTPGGRRCRDHRSRGHRAPGHGGRQNRLRHHPGHRTPTG